MFYVNLGASDGVYGLCRAEWSDHAENDNRELEFLWRRENCGWLAIPFSNGTLFWLIRPWDC